MSVVTADSLSETISECKSTISHDIEKDHEQIESILYPSFGTFKGDELRPKFVKFTKVFPAFPPTHPEGYATIIELEDDILNHKALLALKGGCQYSVTEEGQGYRLKRTAFFINPNNSTGSMSHSWRRCAGVKACEFLMKELKISHTEVDEDGLEWAKLLAEQEKTEANSWDAKVLTLLDEYFDETCSRYVPGSNKPCGGRTVIRSFEDSSKYMYSNRLFIGCEKWKKGQKEHTFIPLQHYDPVAVIQLWGKERCMIHEDIIDRLELNEWFVNPNSIGLGKAVCHAVYANRQGAKKDAKCPFYHGVSGSKSHRQGSIIQLTCDVIFHWFLPQIENGKAKSNYIAVVCYGEHQHPPPPPIRVSAAVKAELSRVIQAYGVAECTARRLISSPILPVMLNGQKELTDTHIALFNHDAINHFIRKLRAEQYPWGTDFQGVQYLMRHQLSDPYIRETRYFEDGHFVVLCQFPEQSRLLLESYEIQADKTFSRTACREFEINSYSHQAHRTTTIARIFTDYEDETGYFEAFKLCFHTAETDMKKRIPWGHLIPASQSPIRVKAILIDEHLGQKAGLARYFETEYPFQSGEWHIARVVKVCRVHFNRSINKLALHVDKKICDDLRLIPHVTLRDHVDNILTTAHEFADKTSNKKLQDWLKHKKVNPWILTCVTLALSSMNRSDWYSTSVDTNIAESSHAQSQLSGVNLTLVTAVQKGKEKDSRYFDLESAVISHGISAKYGNKSISGRTKQSLVRNEARQKKKQKESSEGAAAVLATANELIQRGVSVNAVEEFLASQK